MKKTVIYLLLNIAALTSVSAQCFQTTITNVGNTIIFKVKPTGGDITTGFAAMEFFLRYPDTKTIAWGTVVPNTTNFPNLQITKQTPSQIATETGSTIVYFFQTLLTFTTSATYTNGTEYEVFRITASGTGTADLELLHLDTYLKYWSTMTALDAVTERTCNVKFYGTGATGTAASFQDFFVNNVPLPLELIDFTGKQTTEGVTLNWQTANEQNVNHFIVEKSMDVTDKFVEIGHVKATGNAGGPPQYYSLFDAQPSKGDRETSKGDRETSKGDRETSKGDRETSKGDREGRPSYTRTNVGATFTGDLNYYRLKMVDNDGTFTYSKTIAFKSQNKTSNDIIAFYPNPVTNVLNIVLTNQNYKTATVSLMDMTGRTLLTQSKSSDNQSFVLNTETVGNGIYTAIVTIDGLASLHKVVIAK